MSSSKGKSSGMRILWIPGRKKNHHKGKFDTTSKKVDDYRKTKKIESWSMGGHHGQHELIKTTDIGLDAVGNALPSITIPMAGAVTTAVLDDKTKTEEQILLEKLNEENKDQDLSCSTTDLKAIVKNNEYHGKLNDINNKLLGDVDSIENFNEGKSNTDFDETECGRSSSLTSHKKKKKKSKKNKNNLKGEEELTPEDKTVKCLYFALMCCECSIS